MSLSKSLSSNRALASSGYCLKSFLLIAFFCSFPDQRKNPVVYFKWCDVLNIEPKQEKLTKPLVCQIHFSSKDLQDSTGILKGTFCLAVLAYDYSFFMTLVARAVPRLSLVNRKRNVKKPPVRVVRKSELIGLKVKEELISDEELLQLKVKSEPTKVKLPDTPDSLFIEELMSDVRKMDCMQKEFFKSEMMELIMNDMF